MNKDGNKIWRILEKSIIFHHHIVSKLFVENAVNLFPLQKKNHIYQGANVGEVVDRAGGKVSHHPHLRKF